VTPRTEIRVAPRCPELAPGITFGTRQRCPEAEDHAGPHGSNVMGWWPDTTPQRPADSRDLNELSATGMLWLINRAVFHPRGFALALDVDGGQVLGWQLLGDGSETWHFSADRDDVNFALVEAFLAEHRRSDT
jgi:hypothetical protein